MSNRSHLDRAGKPTSPGLRGSVEGLGLRMPSILALGLKVSLLAALLLNASCARGCTSSRPPIHPNPNMDNQPKYRAQGESRFFYDGGVTQRPVEGTVARGEGRASDPFFTGKDPDGSFIENPLAVDQELLDRGESRFQIFCRPCHGENADGQGMLAERSGVRVGNLLEPRIREMEDGRIFDTITNGFGLMSGYRYPIRAQDRWAIVAYLRKIEAEEDRP